MSRPHPYFLRHEREPPIGDDVEAPYDRVAHCYDGHFARPVDLWEDELLATLLEPYVNDREVMDLGCGTGWLLDHLAPSRYLGVDASEQMLIRLQRKHPLAYAVQARIGEAGWTNDLDPHIDGITTVAATWSAHDFGDLQRLLIELRLLFDWPVDVLCHGSSPRYARREHYVLDGTDPTRGFLRFTPEACRQADPDAFVGCYGTGALPDGLAVWHPLWKAAAVVTPVRYHWAFVAHWHLA